MAAERTRRRRPGARGRAPEPRVGKANYQLGLLLARMGKKDEAEKQLAHAKQLREEDEATSRLQLRLLEPDR